MLLCCCYVFYDFLCFVLFGIFLHIIGRHVRTVVLTGIRTLAQPPEGGIKLVRELSES